MTHPLRRGLVAGAAGTTALNAATYLDQALRGRPPSSTPDQVVQQAVTALGGDVPGSGEVQEHRRTALGALSGILVGLAVGVAASLARAAGFRLPAPVAVVATGAAAMAASDVPATVLGVTAPRDWTASSWAADVLPHLAYGAATQVVIRKLDSDPEPAEPVRPKSRPSLGLVWRSVLLGVATGGCSSLGIAGPALFGRRMPGVPFIPPGTTARSAAGLLLIVELVADKGAGTQSRFDGAGVPLRLMLGAGGAATLARRDHVEPALPTIGGALGAVLGTVGGLIWREQAGDLMPNWQAGLVEDVAAVGLAVIACRG